MCEKRYIPSTYNASAQAVTLRDVDKNTRERGKRADGTGAWRARNRRKHTTQCARKVTSAHAVERLNSYAFAKTAEADTRQPGA